MLHRDRHCQSPRCLAVGSGNRCQICIISGIPQLQGSVKIFRSCQYFGCHRITQYDAGIVKACCCRFLVPEQYHIYVGIAREILEKALILCKIDLALAETAVLITEALPRSAVQIQLHRIFRSSQLFLHKRFRGVVADCLQCQHRKKYDDQHRHQYHREDLDDQICSLFPLEIFHVVQ